MLVIIELIGSLVLIGICAYGVTKLVEAWMTREPPNKDPN